MYEMTETRTCKTCKWWELSQQLKRFSIGTCQCYDAEKKDYQTCCRHRFETESIMDSTTIHRS